MKLLPIILFFLLLPFISLSQINSSIDFIGGIDYSYRNLKSLNPSATIVLDSRNDREVSKLGFRFGFNYNKKVAGKISFKTGLRLASVGYQTKKTQLRWPNQQTGGVFTGDPTQTSKFIYNFFFIEVPLAARFEFSQKKFTPFIELGVAPSLYVKSTNKLVSNSDSETRDNEDSNFKSVHFVGLISFGGNYNINEGLQLFAQPTFRYHLTRLLKETLIQENLFTVGIEVGLRKRIN